MPVAVSTGRYGAAERFREWATARRPRRATSSRRHRGGAGHFNTINKWAAGISDPIQAWRNGDIESFNSRMRDECLNINLFRSLAQARVVDQRLEGGLPPPPATLRARLPGASGPRRSPHPPVSDSR